MHTLRIFIAELYLSCLSKKRYTFDLVAGVINLLLFLIFIQLGIKSFDSSVENIFLDQKLSMLIMGFFSFMVISGSISHASSYVMDGARTGTFEQMILCPLGVKTILLSSVAANSLINVLIAAAIIPCSMLICQHWFSINITQLLILLIPLWLASWGVGFIIASLAVILKKIHSFMNLIQFLVLSLMIIPSYPFNTYSLLPISPQAVTINKLLALKLPLSIPWAMYLYFNGMIYLIFGLFIFDYGVRYARHKGTLGQY